MTDRTRFNRSRGDRWTISERTFGRGHLDIALAPKLATSPHRRARICAAISRELAIEEISGANLKREIWARMVIGLKAFPAHQEAVR
ncbi:hypothetical protein [Bradyrhizobium sp. USDA 4486]